MTIIKPTALQNFFAFLSTGKTSNKKEYFKDFIVLFAIVLLFKYALLFFKGYLYNEPFVDDEMSDSLNWAKVISYVLVLPLFEEILFRGPLALKKNINYIIPIAVTVIFFSLIYIDNSTILLTIVSITVLLTLLIKITRLGKWVKGIVQKYYLLFVIASALLFGAIHMFNYEVVMELKTFISIIGRIISGFYLAYMVTKYNLFSSYVLHGVNNLLVFIILLIVL